MDQTECQARKGFHASTFMVHCRTKLFFVSHCFFMVFSNFHEISSFPLTKEMFIPKVVTNNVIPASTILRGNIAAPVDSGNPRRKIMASPRQRNAAKTALKCGNTIHSAHRREVQHG
ncbi:hypothetical protein [Parazoarcus communis]|uniref:hypothetical protein n=1 Tax=Parazoarcus communis TaxID=41977 RepID=UPI00131EE6B6|nr:hypothetical protein [Parazoarcus communis]